MTKGSSTKKKKSSPPKQDDPGKSMPRLPRTPQQGQAQAQSQAPPQEESKQEPTVPPAFEALLLAMEGRLTAKLEKASEASRQAAQQAKLNSESLEQLESRVDENEQCLMEALRKSEERIMAKVNEQVEGKVKEMVDAQLAAAGFDQDLSAADLSIRKSALAMREVNGSVGQISYARVAKTAPALGAVPEGVLLRVGKKSDYQEDKFWQARRSLRLWPIENGDRTGLEEYLRTKLRMDERFVKEELGEVTIAKPRDPRNKDKAQNEYVVTFENKQVRDEVKAAASNLANFREEAGMKLHVPDHLRRDFQTLMNVSYDLKKKNPDLKRNIKFDEDDLGLYMDLKLKK